MQNQLDKDVYSAVQKVLDDQLAGSEKVSVFTVYDAIKNSNSSLKRRPKNVLEGCIERVLDVLQGQDETDSELELESAHNAAEVEPVNSNAMNRHIVKQMKPKVVTNGVSSVKHTNTGVIIETQAQDVTSDQQSSRKRPREAQKRQNSTIDRPPKRSKAADYAPPTHVSLADLGGMDAVIEDFKEYLMLPLKRPQRYIRRGLKIPRGILLHGPPGCGKTMLSEAVAAELGLPFLQIAAPSIVSGMSGESEKQLREHFKTAVQMAPCLMFIDEIDAITPKRESAQREMERRIVGQLLTCMDDLALEKTNGKPVIVLAATNRPDSLDPALRRAGRFDTEINIGVPNANVREQILKAQTRRTEVAEDVDYARLARMTPGFVGADLESLVYKAGSVSNARYLDALKALSMQSAIVDVEMMDESSTPGPEISATVASFRALSKLLDSSEEIDSIQDDAITMADFLQALPAVQPSSKREGFATIPDTTWANIGALQSVRKQLHNAIVEPIRTPEKYERFGISVPAGVLLWGPPGCGKTLLAKAVANESKANFISVKGPELLNKYVGESERAVRQVFFRARSSVPCVIFFDELDALVPRRDEALSEASARVVNTLLTELDGIGSRSGIYVIAATNRPDIIDPAMLRPGRLGKLLFVDLPGPEERVEILTTLLQTMPTGNSKDLGTFAAREECNGFSGADLSSLLHEAAQKAVEREALFLEVKDLEEAARGVKPSVRDIESYRRKARDGLGKA